LKKLKRGHVRHILLLEDNTVMDILDEAGFEVTGGKMNSMLHRRVLENM
jgi:hypothetical protein